MRRAASYTSLLLLLAFTGGCSSLTQLSNKNPQVDSGFNARVAAEYLAYAQSESEQGQKEDANYYAKKGLRAERGEMVEPETVPESLRQDKPKRYAELTKARARLLKAMSADAVAAKPEVAARAQLLFDCWVDQQQEMASGEIISCGQEFSLTLKDLEKTARKR